jgi:hypothetical protein
LPVSIATTLSAASVTGSILPSPFASRAICGAFWIVPSGSSIGGLQPASPTAPGWKAAGWKAAGGKPFGAATTRAGEKSTVAGKSTTPFTTCTFCTAVVPRAFASFCAVLTPLAPALLPLDESSTRAALVASVLLLRQALQRSKPVGAPRGGYARSEPPGQAALDLGQAAVGRRRP